MDPVAVGKALLDLGGWAAFVIVMLFGAVALHRGWIVPGRYFDRELERAAKLEASHAKNTEAMERLSRSVDTIVEAALQERARRG